MASKKSNTNNKILIFFLLSHAFIWTLAPSISNNNLPLDTIEALAWGSNLDWGFNKHPPLSAFVVEIFFQIFGNLDWAYYLLSQIFVVTAFFVIYIFSKDFFKNPTYSLVSILLLEGIYFYNFTTPEFNANVCHLPFWALTIYYFWNGIKKNYNSDWLLFGFFAALGILSKYTFVYLLVALDVFFIYLIVKKKFNFKCLISLIPFILVLVPHAIWLVDNDYITFTYALHRTGIEDSSFYNDHIVNPFIFLGKQIGVLVPFFIMLLFLVSKFKIKINTKDKKLLFLLTINAVPLILMFLTSIFMGVKIRTMWMTPFYLFLGVLFIYIFQSKVKLRKIKHFVVIFIILFIFSPIAYLYVSITETDKRTDYPGRQISKKINNKFQENFTGRIMWVIGDEWHAGNLSYHLDSRPKWLHIEGDGREIFDSSVGIVTTLGKTTPKISKKFSKLCSQANGKFYIIEDIDYCINGIKSK